ncbi:MAG: uroporphyrinogen-III synthase [Meiothermus sp.]|nr:uroporphyrinogen-III synthase [Meiothermus sp.]
MTVALTQSEGRLAELQALLTERGFEVLRQPLVRTQTLLEASLEPLRDCLWWLFTSSAAVQAALELGAELGRHQLGAVGEATARTLEQFDLPADLISPEPVASSLADAFIASGQPGPVGLPQGNLALPTLEKKLAEAGLKVRPVVVYRTQTLAWPEGLPPADITLLASPSAVSAIPEQVALQTRLLALGSSTAQRIQERGWPYVLTSDPSPKAVLEAVLHLALAHS